MKLVEFQAPLLLKPTSGQAEQVVSKGIFSALAAEPRCCGLVRPRGLRDEVTSLAILEKIMVQKLAPAHCKVVDSFRGSKAPIPLPPPFKASDLWAEQPTLILCLRRPGYAAPAINLSFGQSFELTFTDSQN